MRINYRKIYEQHYGPIPTEKDGRKYEIHHIDGNHSNNDPSNLIAVTFEEHYDIHYAQGDWNACLRLGSRIKIDPKVLSEIARTKTLEQIASGRHPWVGGESARKRVANGTHHLLSGEIQTRSNLARVANGTHPWLNKEKQKEKAVSICKELTKHGMPTGKWCKNNPDKVPVQADIDMMCRWALSLQK